jgi:hypothetical protein
MQLHLRVGCQELSDLRVLCEEVVDYDVNLLLRPAETYCSTNSSLVCQAAVFPWTLPVRPLRQTYADGHMAG